MTFVILQTLLVNMEGEMCRKRKIKKYYIQHKLQRQSVIPTKNKLSELENNVENNIENNTCGCLEN